MPKAYSPRKEQYRRNLNKEIVSQFFTKASLPPLSLDMLKNVFFLNFTMQSVTVDRLHILCYFHSLIRASVRPFIHSFNRIYSLKSSNIMTTKQEVLVWTRRWLNVWNVQ